MAQVDSTFEKGLCKEFSPIKQPKGTYRDAVNIVRDIQGTVKSETGTKFIAEISGLTNVTVLGESELEDSIYYFIKADEGSYIYKLTSSDTLILISDSDDLNFSSPIDVQSRKDFKGSDILYFTDGQNVPRRLDTTETYTALNFDTLTRLFLNPTLPRVSDLEVVEGGGLPTGIYKFAARLGTDSGNVSTFGQISQGIPIVDDVQASGQYQYDGAPPQSTGGKTITISLENIDTAFDYVEIAAVTYIGLDNTLQVTSISKIPISGDSLTFDYYDTSQQIADILAEELVAQPIEYSTADHMVQKDNHLFLSNLKTTDTSVVDSLMQSIADNIEVHYTVDTRFVELNSKGPQSEVIDSSGNISDWSDAGNYYYTHGLQIGDAPNPLFASYKNPHLTFDRRGYQRDEVYSFAIVPIFKGGIYGNAYHIPGDSNNPTFEGNEGSYSTSRLRGWQNSDGTYHHRMPPASETAPAFLLHDEIFNLTQIAYNILGVEFRGVDLSDPLLQNTLEGYVVVRQRRNKPGNGIVTAQGIAKEFYEAYDSGIMPIPQLGKTSLFYRPKSGESLHAFGNPATTGAVNHGIVDGYFSFYAPDIIHGIVGASYDNNISYVKQVNIFKMERTGDNRLDPISYNGSLIPFGALYATRGDLRSDGGTDTSGLGVYQPLSQSSTTRIEPFRSSARTTVPLNDGTNVKMSGTVGSLILKTSSGRINKDFTKYSKNSDNMQAIIKYQGDIEANVGTGALDLEHRSTGVDETLELYNLYSYTNNVYGSLTTAEYIMVEERYFDETPGTTVQMYGGDTFISRYMYMLGEAGDTPEFNFRANAEVFVETRGNYEYRHFEPKTFDGDTEIEGTMPYAPKYPLLLSNDPTPTEELGIWNYSTSSGPGSDYNKHYNFENTINKYYPKDLFLDPVTTYPNRIIYSLESFDGEQFDAYRVFLTNNFHDVPKESGSITGLFDYNNTLYASSAHALWRTFVNEKTFTNTSSGDIVLGNGGLFPIPSKRIFTQEGGYAGTTTKYAGVNTPYGRFFVDNHQRKVFLLMGSDKLDEISNPMMNEYFSQTLTADGQYQSGYDPLHKRVLLTLDPNTSISYSFELKSWSSLHTYGAEKWAHRDNKLLLAKGNQFYEMGTGPLNTFLGDVYPSTLQFILNQDYTITKDFINFKWIQRYKDTIFSNLSIETENFTTGAVLPSLVTSFADEQNFLSLGEQHVHQIGGEHRMTIPPDNNPSGGYTDELFRPTIKGKYGIVDLTYTPGSNPLELEYFSTEYINVSE